MRRLLPVLLSVFLWSGTTGLFAQRINHVKVDNLDLIFFGKRYDYLLPHVSQTYANAMAFHHNLWNYEDTTLYVVLNDFEDHGHAGALVMPFSQVQIGIEPYGFAFSIIPSNERFQWLFNHELTHVVMADKANRTDRFFRSVVQGKVRRNEEKPVSALWSYVTVPRWYTPRWYHEGIACFMETWMSGGLGRTMGTYDEMYFRTIVNENKRIYSLIGLETEGTTIDFQVGANSYLYGTRFVTYLAKEYGIDRLTAFYTRSDSSKSFFADQFRNVYNLSLRKAWEDWIQSETRFQQENIRRIREFPITPFSAITAKPLGNVSNYGFNPSTGKIYAALNYPGIVSRITEIDVRTGKMRKIATLDSPLMYFSTSLTYDPAGEKIFISEHNSKYRNLVEIDVKSGRKRILNRMTRAGDLAFNQADRTIWGVRNDNGYSILVKIPEPYDRVVPIFTAPFGKVIFDLAVSNKGDRLCASLSGIRGEQSVILFDINELDQGTIVYHTILTLEDNTLTQFKFSTDDRFLIGTSYYTGVSNVWRINLEDNSFELLSNTETGLFMPLQISDDSLLALKFQRDGMTPGIMPIKVLEDANSIIYLGNLVHQTNPVVEEWSLPPASQSGPSADSLNVEAYRPIGQMRLANAYPDLAGFKKTVAVGYRLNWRDPIGLSDIDLFLAASPWSSYENKQKIHAQLQWKLWSWSFKANYNPTHFYDLFGPTRRSRAGYTLGISYERQHTLKSPFKWNYDFGIYHYGDLEVLPDYQNVTSPIRRMQAATASIGVSKLRKTLGGVEDECGYTWNLITTSYLALGKLYPSVVSNQDFGVMAPFVKNTSFWIRNSVGQSFGDRESSLASFYFGGFRNNYLDWQPSEHYRKTLAFPGAQIDEIPAYNFVKTMGELNLRPIRLRDVGTSWLYPTFIKSSLFGTHIMTNFDRPEEISHIFNLGAQVDIQLVLFSYLKTTWSAGYARIFYPDATGTNGLMFSLKLLGD
ncbi:MAG: hypothetical protein V2A67_11840 [Bacteroidota bacterium]